MPESLLLTKMYIPPPRPNFVSRPRLIARLNQGLREGNKLTLICAPAGFGKTTLIAEWLSGLTEKKSLTHTPVRPFTHSQVAWLSLDKNDNDPIRFLTYFTATLNQAIPKPGGEIQAMLSSSQSSAMEPFIGVIINDIMAAGDSNTLVLILEDYHFIDSPVIHEGLSFLLDHLPPRLHVVITSRSDPPLLLSRLRARNQMTEIRARDLRFTTREVAAFLNGTMGLNLAAEMVTTFEQRTEGWIAGLQLAAMSLQQQDDPHSFVTAFAGDDRYVADYLMEEVFQQQTASVQTFLLGTSILDSLNAPLCDAVMEEENSRITLNELEASNLFIVPLDNQRRWYRYHHLFADLLRRRLEESTPSQDIETLHRRASRWYEEHDFFFTAVEHALLAGDYQWVVRLIEQGEEKIFQASRLNTLLRWRAKIPTEIVESRPKFCLIYSWALIATGHWEEAESYLQAIERVAGAKMDSLFAKEKKGASLAPEVRVNLTEIAVVRGQLAITRGDIGASLELSRLVLPYLDEIDQPYLHSRLIDLRSVVNFNMGLTYKLQGKLSEAEPALTEAMILAQESGNPHLVAAAFGHLADVQAIRGYLPQALQTCHQGLQMIQEMSGQHSPMSGQLQAELGALLYERNNLDLALDRFTEGISVARRWGYLDALVPCYIGLARLRGANNDWHGAFSALNELAELGQSNPEAVMPAVESYRARLEAAQGNIKAAGLWAEKSGLHFDGELNYLREEENIVLVRVLMAQERWEDAAHLVGRLLEVTESGERWGRVLELLILQALALDAQDQPVEALEPLTRALLLAEPQGYVRIFVDEREPIAKLLYRAAGRGITPGYTGKLLAVFQDGESTSTGEPEIREPKSGIIEPLSARELEVLDCLTEGLSNREIAQRLSISLTTVKSHTRNIYRKLDVNSRTQAVAKAKSFGIEGS